VAKGAAIPAIATGESVFIALWTASPTPAIAPPTASRPLCRIHQLFPTELRRIAHPHKVRAVFLIGFQKKPSFDDP